MQLAEQQRLSEEEEMRILREELGKILATVYPNMPTGHSKAIDNLRKVVGSGQR